MNHPITQQLLEGAIVREPIGEGKGYWVGAPGWRWDEPDQAAYLTYRIRRPHGVEPDRGGESRIAKTSDFVNFEDVWSVQKNQYDSSSIEKSNLMRGGDGVWRAGRRVARWPACGAPASASSFPTRPFARALASARDTEGRTALHCAAYNGPADVCAALLARADFTEVNAKDGIGRTARQWAVQRGHAAVARLIAAAER